MRALLSHGCALLPPSPETIRHGPSGARQWNYRILAKTMRGYPMRKREFSRSRRLSADVTINGSRSPSQLFTVRRSTCPILPSSRLFDNLSLSLVERFEVAADYPYNGPQS